MIGLTVTTALMRDPAIAALFMNLHVAMRRIFFFCTCAKLALENLALRQQLANPRHTSGGPRIRMADRVFWVVLLRLWSRASPPLVPGHGSFLPLLHRS